MNLLSNFINYQQKRAKVETLKVFRTMSDWQLEDCGISREMLSYGINAWPWTQPEDTTNVQISQVNNFEELPSSNSPNLDSSPAKSKPQLRVA